MGLLSGSLSVWKTTRVTGEITVRYDYPPIKLAKIKNIDYAKCWGCEKLEIHMLMVRMQNCTTILEKSFGVY